MNCGCVIISQARNLNQVVKKHRLQHRGKKASPWEQGTHPRGKKGPGLHHHHLWVSPLSSLARRETHRGQWVGISHPSHAGCTCWLSSAPLEILSPNSPQTRSWSPVWIPASPQWQWIVSFKWKTRQSTCPHKYLRNLRNSSFDNS